MKLRKYLVMVLPILGVLVLGCVEKDISSAVNTLPEIQQYLKEHPDAKITAIYMSKEEVEKISQDINNQCGKTITPTDMYKVIITDKGLKIISWIDTKNKTPVCSFTEGIENINANPVQTAISAETGTTPTATETIENTPRPTTSLQSYCGDLDTKYEIVTGSEIYSRGTSGKCIQFTGKVYKILPKSIINEKGVQKEISAFEVGVPNNNYLVYVSIPTYKIEGNVQLESVIEVKGKDSGNYREGAMQPVIWAQGNIKTISADSPIATVVKTPYPTSTEIIKSHLTVLYNVKETDKTIDYVLSDGPVYKYPKSGKTFLILTLKVTNNGPETLETYSGDWGMSIATKDEPNTYIKVNSVCCLGDYDYQKPYPNANINPGGSLTGQILFEVPINWNTHKLDYEWSYKKVKVDKWEESPNILNAPAPTSSPTPAPTSSLTPAPTSSPSPSSECDSSYPTLCIPPPPPDLDCKDIPEKNFKVFQPDPHDFDRDEDGIGCES